MDRGCDEISDEWRVIADLRMRSADCEMKSVKRKIGKEEKRKRGKEMKKHFSLTTNHEPRATNHE
jgi:hypothetical protein